MVEHYTLNGQSGRHYGGYGQRNFIVTDQNQRTTITDFTHNEDTIDLTES